MALIVKDRVREITSTTGTGTITLTAAVVGFQSFSVIGDGNTTYYTIVDAATGAFEVGIGTYTASGTTLSRDTVLESSNANALVNFSSGTKDVFVTYPADRSVSQADIGTAPNEIPLNQYLGSMAYQDLESVTIDGGVATLGTATISSIQNNTNISETEPTLDLNFAKVKALDPRITFARASTGTYYDGKTYAKAEENLLKYSQEFNLSPWLTNQSGVLTISANSTTAPDGTTTADTATPNASSGYHVARQSGYTSAEIHTFSVFVKPNGYTQVAIREDYVVGQYAAFDLTSTGSVVDKTGSASASITALNDGWYRITLTPTTAIVNQGIGIYVLDGSYVSGDPSSYTYTGDGTSGVYLWGAQLEQRSVVSSYTPTTTQPITRYQPALQTAASGVARFDHDPVTQESLGLLIEEQRTNLLTYAEDFSNWVNNNPAYATVIPNISVAPDGTLTADKIQELTGTVYPFIYNSPSISSGVSYTQSYYVKSAGRQWVFVNAFYMGAYTSGAYFDIVNGVVGAVAGVTANIVSTGNGWYRISITGVSVQATPSYCSCNPTSANGVNPILTGYTGDGYSGIFLWGAQLEAGAFPTSYIPTVASQVTRSADSASMTGTNFSSWYRADEGTVYSEYKTPTGVGMILNIHSSPTANQMQLFAGSTAGVSFFVQVNGVSGATIGSRSSIGKTIAAYKFNDFAASTNSSTAATSTSGTIPIVNALRMGARSDGVTNLNGHIKKITYFPKRLDNAELVEMTEQ